MAAGFLLELRVDGDATFLDEKGWGTMTSFTSHGLPAQRSLDFTHVLPMGILVAEGIKELRMTKYTAYFLSPLLFVPHVAFSIADQQLFLKHPAFWY